MESKEITITLAVLENTDKVMVTHGPDKCQNQNEFCTIHNRSNHSMRGFPQLYRRDRNLMERICSHGIGHPDPDDPKIINGWTTDKEGVPKNYELVHGCDGCCNGSY
jgi:hypothetical protein